MTAQVKKILAVVVHFPILINQGIFWDDWTIFQMSPEGLNEQALGAGFYYSWINGLRQQLAVLPHSVFWYHLLACAFSLTSVYLFWRILHHFRELNDAERTLVCVIFLINPFYAAKVTMICLPYTISLFLFLAGFLLFVHSVDRRHLIVMVMSLVLFLCSFVTQSFVVVYLVVPLYFYYKNRHLDRAGLFQKAIPYSAFFLLPFVFAILRMLWLMPTGIYALHYNQFYADSLWSAPMHLLRAVVETVVGPFLLFYRSFGLMTVVGLALAVIIIFLFRVYFRKIFTSPDKVNRNLLWAGAGLIILGSIPYVLVGKIPSFYGYDTRLQLIVPLGFSLVAVYAITWLVNPTYRYWAAALMVVILTMGNLQLQFRYLVGWMKEESLKHHFEGLRLKGVSNTLEVQDHTKEYDATNAPISFFELSGMTKLVTGKETTLFVTPELFNSMPENVKMADYMEGRRAQGGVRDRNITDYYPDGTCQTVVISVTEKKLNTLVVMTRLVTHYYFFREEFNKEIGDFVKVEYLPGCSEGLVRKLR